MECLCLYLFASIIILYRSLFSKFVNFFIFWMNNLTHVKFDIQSLWSLIKNGFFFFFLGLIFEFNVLPLLQNSPWFCQGSTTSPNYIFHSSHKKKTLISFFFYSFSVFSSPLKFILFIILLNPFKIDSTIAFILYCLRSYGVCSFLGYCRIQYATLGSLKLVYFSFRFISAYILIFKLQAL